MPRPDFIQAPRDPISGPIPREKFVELINAPFGEATKVIRKYDPLYGREDGEVIRWNVKFARKAYETGYATVEASSKEEAEKIASEMSGSKIDWEPDYDDELGEIIDIEPIGDA